MLPLVLCPTIITGEPDECEAGTGDTIVVVAGVDMVVVIAERAGVAPAGVEDVTVVSVVVVSLPFRFAGEAFMILRKTRASGGIRSRFSVVCRLDGTAWEGLDLRDEEEARGSSHPDSPRDGKQARKSGEMTFWRCSCRAEGRLGSDEGVRAEKVQFPWATHSEEGQVGKEEAFIGSGSLSVKGNSSCNQYKIAYQCEQ
jgi:hypothetical protein